MKIVLLNQYYAPAEAATAQLLTDLGQALVGAGHEVSVVCSCRSYPDPRERYPGRERVNGVTVHRTRTTGFGRGRGRGRLLDYGTFALGAAWRLVVHERPDVVVSLTTPPMVCLLGLLAGRLSGAGTLFWVMDIYPDLAFELGVLSRRSWIGRTLDRLSRYALRRSTLVVALGETMATELERRGARRPRVVHNWADGEEIRPLPLAAHALRAAWGWDDRFVVLYSGNLGLAHEFETVLDAARILRDEPRVRFAFVGGGPRLPEVREEVERRGLPNVEFRPHVERRELGQSLTAGDVHLVTLRERLPGLCVPSKIYGVLAAGRPTLYVGPAEGEVPAILAAGRCGAVLAPGDAQRLAETIRAYATDSRRGEEEGRRARILFDERFSRDRALAELTRLVEQAGRSR